METIYLVYGYFTDIEREVMLRVFASKIDAEEYVKQRTERPIKGQSVLHIEEEFLW